MIDGRSVLAVIAARGGSKTVPKKNIRKLAEKPLIAWTIEAAKQAQYIDRLILSSDDPEIIAVAQKYGCEVPFIRPAHLSNDEASSAEVIAHAIQSVQGYDYILLLQPTSPFRTSDDIDGGIRFCVENGAHSCISIVEVESTPYWMFKVTEDKKLISLIEQNKEFYQRQKLPPVYERNGALYIMERQWFEKTKDFVDRDTIGYIMTREHSIDIDTQLDFAYAQWYFEMFLRE